MIDVHYRGRLGNNLFQYCLGRILAESLGFELCAAVIPGFPNTAEKVTGASHSAPEQMLTGQRIDLAGVLADRTPRRVVLHGYFQQLEYYRPHRDKIRRWLALDPSVVRPPMKPDLVLHVRRTDYIPKGWALPFSFYRDAVDRLLPAGGELWIATDDRRDPFFRQFTRWRPRYFEGSPLENFAFLLQAPRLVISQSSFSWWPAFLGENQLVAVPLSRYGLWTGAAEDADLIDRERFVCIESNEPQTLSGAEKWYHWKRALRLRVIQKLNRDFGFSLPEAY
jgi:hypothetical protein